MARALILYHSLFGNTKAVAISLARGIEEAGIESEGDGYLEEYKKALAEY